MYAVHIRNIFGTIYNTYTQYITPVFRFNIIITMKSSRVIYFSSELHERTFPGHNINLSKERGGGYSSLHAFSVSSVSPLTL